MNKPSVEHIFCGSKIYPRITLSSVTARVTTGVPEDPMKHFIHNIYEISQLLAAFSLQPTDPWHSIYPLPHLFPLSIDLYPNILKFDSYLKHC